MVIKVIVLFVVLAVGVHSSTPKADDSKLIVKTHNGELRGTKIEFEAGIKGFYYSFQGIKYGQAPVGARRFRAALKVQPWKGVRDATKEGDECPQLNIFGVYTGNEDCLHLNVHTKQLPNKNSQLKLPVMFYVHGGSYNGGDGGRLVYGPDYLIDKDVILVTINYRLGALGFLAVGGDAPGNAGLKDQVLALKWVKTNIAAFGGDPSKVTIFGESAGGGAVHLLMLSPLAAGLFHRAISQSGSAIASYTLQQTPKVFAFSLGKKLGIDTNSTQKLLDFLRTVPPQKIVNTGILAGTLLNRISSNLLPDFSPVIEDPLPKNVKKDSQEERFLTEHPLVILKSGKFNNVPYITGFNSDEALILMKSIKRSPELLEEMNKEDTTLIPLDLHVPGGRHSAKAKEISTSIREFYFGKKKMSKDNVDGLIKLFSDCLFIHSTINGARLHARNAKTYVYEFGYDGTMNIYKQQNSIEKPGVCHADDLAYLFFTDVVEVEPKSPAFRVKDKMVLLWTNFAKYGNPTPQGKNDKVLGVEWLPVDKKNAMLSLPYLKITGKGSLEMKSNPLKDRVDFWDKLYAKYNIELLVKKDVKKKT